ncbi:hypothetical protein HN011_008223, partial [Eciton burchellii]
DLHQDPLGTSIVQKTAIGWIISEPIGIALCNANKVQVSHCISECNTNSLLRKFWEDEEIPQQFLKKNN